MLTHALNFKQNNNVFSWDLTKNNIIYTKTMKVQTVDKSFLIFWSNSRIHSVSFWRTKFYATLENMMTRRFKKDVSPYGYDADKRHVPRRRTRWALINSSHLQDDRQHSGACKRLVFPPSYPLQELGRRPLIILA